MAEWIEPNTVGQEEFDEWYLRARRRGVSPGVTGAIFDNWLRTDPREVLPAVHVPTLVIGRPDALRGTSHARFVADHIPDARYVELPGPNTLVFLGDFDSVVREVEGTGARAS